MTELAQTLRSERLKQGLSLQDIFERTRISVGVLQSLEEGNYERIGTPLLVRSFIRTYGSALGIDPEPLLESHMPEIQACDKQQEGILEYQRLSLAFADKRSKWMILVVVLAAVAVGGITAGTWISRKMEKMSVTQSLTKEIIPQEELPSDLPRTAAKQNASPDGGADKVPEKLATSAPNIDTPPSSEEKEQLEQPAAPPLTGEAFVSLGSGLHQEEAAPKESTLTSQESPPEPAAGVSNSTEPLPQAEQLTSQTEGHTLSAEATQEVWVQVRADNKNIYNGLMKPGEKREWKTEEAVQIVVGNAGGIHFKWNGKSIRALGKPGEVARFRLPDPKYLE
jgi:cytoskeleton protein RodZ